MSNYLNANRCRRQIVSILLPFVLLSSVVAAVNANVAAAGAHSAYYPTRYDRNTLELNLQQRLNQQQDVEDYTIWDASHFPEALGEWEEKYPDLIRVTTAQKAYGLPTAGDEKDCPFYEEKGCPNYFFTIQDYITHPVGSDSSSHLPEIFWSGAVHGDERVGPTSVMEASSLLLESAYCEGLPRHRASDRSADLKEAKDCRKSLRNKGIDDVHRKWLARLVSTRRIVVAPTANALGYYRHKRTEGGTDPNRDFPYDLKDTRKCIQTIAGRTINEIYRDHMFQLAFTFHAGMEVVAYEWGAPSWYNHLSPDDEAQSQIGRAYSEYGGGWRKSKPYKYGTMNDEVYYVRGGMEDWAYAGSWTPSKVDPCTPKQFGGYPTEKTIYNNSTLRVFNILVETSDNKNPPKNQLGNSMDVLSGNTMGNGHVSRNIRLTLLSADLVEPYVSVVGVNKLALTDDVVPMTDRDSNNCVDTKGVMVARNAETIDIEWTVGGAMTIDSTELWYGKWDDVTGEVECWTQPSSTDKLKKAGDSFQGTGFFSADGSQPNPEESATGIKMTNGPLFRASVPLKEYKKGDKILVMASARVDQSWKKQPKDILPKVPPQSHVVNARTDSSYHHESNGKHIQGRIDWFSVPLTVVVGDFKDSVGTRGVDSVNVVEIHPRLGESTINKGGVKPKSAQNDQLWFPVALWKALVGFLLVITIFICCFRYFMVGNSNGKIRVKQRGSFDESDDLAFEQNQYSDQVDDEYGDDEESDDGIEIPDIS